MEKDEELLWHIIRSLVDYPDSARITRTTDDMGILLTLDLHHDDMGKVIGKEGNTVKAIRTILHAAGSRARARVNLRVNDPVDTADERRQTDREMFGA